MENVILKYLEGKHLNYLVESDAKNIEYIGVNEELDIQQRRVSNTGNWK